MHKTLIGILGLFLILLAIIPINAQGPSTPSSVAHEGKSVQGGQVYTARCLACHQQNGKGVASAFPPLAGHVPEAFAKPEGREYLLKMVLFGVEGPIKVDGQDYDGGKPGWALLDDKQLAAVLNYLFTAWGNDKLLPADFKPIEPSEIAAVREPTMTASEVLALRKMVFPEASTSVSEERAESVHLTFTAEQVERGKDSYARYCLDCHGEQLNDGEYCPPLKGPFFNLHWENGSVAAFHGKLKSTMPIEDPGGLSEQTYLDLTSYILSQNGYEPGEKELPADPKVQVKMSLKKNATATPEQVSGHQSR